MKRIQVLDNHTCNQIAAGEVVERPSSVVKELVENSIDAKAKNIRVELIDGGHKMIKIIDDGAGIHPDDIETAFITHATSKIKNINDIYKVESLGFRGEALPSIASVSKIKISSKCNQFEYGKELHIQAGEIKSHSEIGRGNGTTITVEDLFYNVPARQKFLKSTSKEGAAVNDLLMRLAICNPQIAFSFFRNDKKVFSTKGTGDINEAIRSIYGKETVNNVIPFENQSELSTVHGFIGNESLSRGSRSRQTIFVNGRYIKNSLITTAVEKAFKSFLTVNKFPFFILFVNIAPDIIDVNIHPSKSEIKFKEDRAIFKLVFNAVHKALSNDLKNEFLVSDKIQVNDSYLKINHENLMKLNEEIDAVEKLSSEFDKTPPFVDDTSDRRNGLGRYDSRLMNDGYDYRSKKNKNAYNSNNKVNQLPRDNKTFEDAFIFKDEIKEHRQTEIETDIPVIDVLDSTFKEPKFQMPRVIGQYNKTYILAEIDETLFLFDQHAAHEKILFEKYCKSIDKEEITSQILAVPVIMELTPEEFACFEENNHLFSKTGFVCDLFGGNSISIREVPNLLRSINVEETFMAFLRDFIDMGQGIRSEIKFDTIAKIACRKAVKANDRLNHIEMEYLIDELRFINEPFTCPHGRPTIIKFTTMDIEKMFKRIQ